MPYRLLALATIALAALTSCGSSGRYGSPGYAAAAVGAGAVGAVASKAMGGCYAMCQQGTHCNAATGLCEAGEASPIPASAAPSSTPARRRPPVSTMRSSYAPGHEYEIPPLGDADAGCEPVPQPGGGVACEMDGGSI